MTKSSARPVLAVLLVALLATGIAACSSAGSPAPTPTAPATPTAAPSDVLSEAQLKTRLITQLGPLWYCDPDFYPVSRDDEATRALERWPEVTADVQAFAAIVEHLALVPGGAPTDAQKLAVYREWKMLAAITLEPSGAVAFRFEYLAQPPGGEGGGGQGTRSIGTIQTDGRISVDQSEPGDAPNCPICLARGERIETPAGSVAVETLRIGQEVWTLDSTGRPVVGTVIALGSAPVPAGHEVIRLALADGRSLTASPGHPLADGRSLGTLQAGDLVDGSTVVTADRVAYDGGRTFDLLVSGATGAYSIDGIWLGSTLTR